MNAELAELFRRIARLLEIKGESAYKINAYKRVARSLSDLDAPVEEYWRAGRLKEIPGVGDAIAKKIDEYLRTGTLQFLERLESEVPPSLLELTALPGIGPKKARLLWQELGITDIDALAEAAEQGKLRALKGFSAQSEQRILEGIKEYRARPKGFLLGLAYPTALALMKRLRALPAVSQVELAGSVRRGREMVNDIDIAMAAPEPDKALLAAADALHLPHGEPQPEGDCRALEMRLPSGIPLHLIACRPEIFGFGWVMATGSAAHTDSLGELAVLHGKRLTAADFPASTEQEFYGAFGLDWIPPELREGAGELEAAAHHALPNLLTEADLRADLHTHTDWSDGRATMREMVAAAVKHGVRVLAITDHSASLGVANGLTPERLRQQREEIRRVQEEFGDAILLLQGAEVEILADGSLDYPDEVLSELDVVVASLHTGLRQPRERITARLLNAIANPHVHIIGHPSGRLLPDRPPADLDWDAVLQAAAEHGVALEINAHPRRLDLKPELARRAISLGIPLALNTDAHTPADFNNRFYGVIAARRAWATPENIINSWGREKLLSWLRAR